MNRRTMLAMMIGTVAFAFGAHAEGKSFDFRRGFADVAAQATPAVVFIQVEKEVPVSEGFFNNPFDLFGEDFPERFFGRGWNNRFRREPRPRQPRKKMYRKAGQGSGFLISKDGYILTNTHVVGDVDKITVKLQNGKEFKAKRIGADSKTEVALIKIEADGDLPFLKAGDPEKLMTGEWVIAIGNPFGLKETLTVGVVSAKGRSNMGITDYEDFIQTDAAINPGNSGGPLLNIDGEVIGINTAIYSRNGGNMGIGFAVPINMAFKIKEQLLANGKVTRGYIGVMLNPGDLSEAMAESFGRKEAGGVLIADVLEDGPAYKAGIKPGDIITELNGEKIDNGMHFRNKVAQIMPDTKVNVTIYRDGKTLKRTVTVAAYPDEEDASESVAGEGGTAKLEKLGLGVQDVTEKLANQLGLDAKAGVVITEVFDGSSAEEAGLKAGMLILEVNRHEVKTVKDLERELKKAKNGNILLRVKTEKGAFFASLTLND
ncbi:MAG: Do family serine endopeptidase [Kiritimatiellae bacterium]|nr:Do family serine endopeptidase [Kiritimatiellia bacterium]